MRIGRVIAVGLMLGFPIAGTASVPAESDPYTADALKRMSLEELAEIEVTLVSRTPVKLGDAASAIQVITRDEIRRSGALTLADAMRLASNLHVAQANAHTWIISARGMNASSNTPPNKLLVMIDGRTIYTPLFAGVFWGQHQLILDDVERIEVVSGPGGSVWGANAVNGVINIVTLPAGETQGAFAEAGGGTFMRGYAAARYGGKAGRKGNWRVYGQRLEHNGSDLATGKADSDDWGLTRGGMRMDLDPTDRDRVSLQAEAAVSESDQAFPAPGTAGHDAQFAQARWNRALSRTAEIQAKAYFDRTWLDLPGSLSEALLTFDTDAFHGFAPFRGNRLLWGAGYRLQIDAVENPEPALTSIQLRPATKRLPLYSLYFEDEQEWGDGRVRLTVGARLEHNAYSGWEAMPSIRAAWSPLPGQTAWGAVSRAVRSPGRLDVEAFQPPPSLVADGIPALEGGPDLTSEKLHAYEAGLRSRLGAWAAVSAAAFAHSYEELRILEEVAPLRYRFTNGLRGEVYGAELACDAQPFAWWRLRGGYTRLYRDLYPIAGHVEVPQPGNNGNDPAWHASLYSWWDLPRGFGLDAAGRIMDGLAAPRIPGYAEFDLGASWSWRTLTVSIAGRNLAEARHAEALESHHVPRSVSGRAAVRF